MKKSHMMRSGSTNAFEIDKNKVMEEISKTGQFQSENIFIKKWENDQDSEGYLSHLTKNNSTFIGPLNESFQREGYGINNLENGDKYLGYFEKDKRNKHGIYFFAPEEKNDKILHECYHGFWKNNSKEKNGIYIWLEESNDNNIFDNANFDAYVGEIENDGYKRGTYLSKISDDYYLYHGNFDSKGRKTDNDAFFYSSKYDRLLHGKIFEDCFLNGYISYFDSETGLIVDLAYTTFDKEGSLINIISKDDIEKDEINKEEKVMTLFRNIILGVDYFGSIYSKYKNSKKFIEENMNDIDIFDDRENFPKIIDLCAEYNTNNIYNDIEKKVFNKSEGYDKIFE